MRAESTSRSAISAVLEPLRNEREHLQLARRQARGVLASRLTGPAQTQAAAELGGGRTRAEPAELGECRLVACVRERARRLVRAEALGPRLGRTGDLAVQLEAIRGRDPVRRLVELARFPLPVGQLAGVPQVPLLERERVDGPRFLHGAVRVAGEPRRLGARRVDMSEPLEVSTRPGCFERVVEGVEGARVAAPGPDSADRDQRADPADRIVRVAEDLSGDPCPLVHRPRYRWISASQARRYTGHISRDSANAMHSRT